MLTDLRSHSPAGSPMTSKAAAYAWRQLAGRAGVTGEQMQDGGPDVLDIPVYYADPEQVGIDRPGIIIVPASGAAWHELLEREPRSLSWVPSGETVPAGIQLPFKDTIPVLFWGAGYEDGQAEFVSRRGDGSVVFHADVLAAAFFMLSRWEEAVIPALDEHQRFPAEASVACKQEFLDRPIVDEYAMILRQWIKAIVPSWMPARRQFSVKLGHDVDRIQPFRSPLALTRRLAGDLLKRHSPSLAWAHLGDALLQVVAPRQTSHLRGIQHLSEMSSRYGLDSTFYFMTADRGLYDNGYSLEEPIVNEYIQNLTERGFGIGFHPGYETLNNPERLAAEKSRFDRAVGQSECWARQHFLRFRVPDTWRHLEEVGVSHDSTMAYAGREGFRCGTCHQFRPFDVEQDRELALWEVPLIAMDRTVRDYRGSTPDEGKAHLLGLARKCERVEGTFTLLWHNFILDREWAPWRETYREIVQALAQMERGGGGGVDDESV